MSGIGGTIVSAWFEDGETAAREMTLRIEHKDGTHTFVVVDINRMTPRLKGNTVVSKRMKVREAQS
jgi:hypothetical protein